MLISLDSARASRVKAAYSVRRLDPTQPLTVTYDETRRPRHGDIVLAEVTTLGYHTVLELGDGRKARLYVGDEVLVAYGPRYAPDHFEADGQGP